MRCVNNNRTMRFVNNNMNSTTFSIVDVNSTMKLMKQYKRIDKLSVIELRFILRIQVSLERKGFDFFFWRKGILCELDDEMDEKRGFDE